MIRLLQHQCMMTYRELSNRVKNNRGILALLRTRPDRLTKQQVAKRDVFLAENPAIEAIYQFQQQLHALLMNRAMNKEWCRRAIPRFLEMIHALKTSTFKPLVALGRVIPPFLTEVKSRGLGS